MNLHIITLNIPYPPDYGGMIDSYYRIRTLKKLGIRIHLHCFEYGRKHSGELESLCETTTYYPRRTGFLSQLSSVPYIVSGRRSEILLRNLVRDDFPILFDGLHSTFYLDYPALSNRKKLVRMHNIEHRYYGSLSSNEQNIFKKTYYRLEAVKLRWYESVLRKADNILAISQSDHEYFRSKYQKSFYLAPSHPFSESRSLTGLGDYIIYHGDLSVNENIAVSDFLISEIFSKIPYKCIIAGKNPPEILKSHASRYANIVIIPDPDNDIMEKLIVNAQINLLPALTCNGFKLKLLMALYAGRHCIVNSVLADNNSILKLCHVADSGKEIISTVHLLMKSSFTYEMISDRMSLLSENFDAEVNTKRLVEMINN